jgi:O-antigen/teichoic acid export membrane protein
VKKLLLAWYSKIFSHSIYSSIFHDAAIIALGIGGARLTSLIFRYLAMRVMSIDSYGQFAFFVSWYQIFTPFASFHAGHALAIAFSNPGNKAEQGGWMGASLVASTLTCILLTPIVLVQLPIETNNRWLMTVATFWGLICIATVVIAQGVARGLMNPFSVSVFEWGMSLGRIALLLMLSIFGLATNQSPYWAFLLGSLLGALLGWRYLIKTGALLTVMSTTWREITHRLGELIRFSSFIILAQALTFGIQFISRWSLVRLGFEKVAIYDSAMLLYSILGVAFTGVGLAVVPYASQITRNSPQYLPLRRFLWLCLPVGGMVLLTFTPLLPRALEFIGLADYVPAIPVWRVLLLAAPLELAFVVGANILIGLRKTRTYFLCLLLSLPLHILSTWILASLWGETGVAVAYIITQSILLWQANQHLRAV